MTNESPVNVTTTALMTVDATARVTFYAGGDKIGQHAVNNGIVPPSGIVQSIRFGATHPEGLQASSLLIQAIYGWSSVLTDTDAGLVSGNLNYAPASGVTPLPVVSIPLTLDVLEGQTLQVPVTKTGSGACSVRIRTIESGAKNTIDYTGFLQVISFGANDTLINVPLPTLSDADSAEVNETLRVELSLPVDCTRGNALSTVTIRELPRISIASTASANEGNPASIIVTKAGVGACSVTYRTVAVTATLNVDYTAIAATTLSFASADVQKTITVQTLADTETEPDQTFNVLLENESNCIIDANTCTVTIVSPVSGGGEPVPTPTSYPATVNFANTNADGTKNDFGIGQVPYYVTSLLDTNVQGTLRHACSAGNRLILFEVGGCIKMSSQNGIQCRQHNITIAGETAPSPGIILQGGDFTCNDAENLCIRHITFERGYDYRQEAFVLTNPPTIAYNSNGDVVIITADTNIHCRKIWFDHCTFLWGNDECIQVWRQNSGIFENVSFSNCIFAESLYMPEDWDNPATNQPYKGHWERGIPEKFHNYGLLIGNSIKRFDVQNCAMIDTDWRNPFIDANSTGVLANNVNLNNSLGAHISCNSGFRNLGPFLVTSVGYLKIGGSNIAPKKTYCFKFHTTSLLGAAEVPPYGIYPTSKVWVTNQYGWRGAKTTYTTPTTAIGGRNGDVLNPSEVKAIMNTTGPISGRPIDIPTAPVQALTDKGIYDRAIANVGTRPKDRDATGKRKQHHVERQIQKLRNQDSQWLNHPEHDPGIGGFSKFSEVRRSLRDRTGKFANGDIIEPMPTATDKAAVRSWLRRFLDDVQYD